MVAVYVWFQYDERYLVRKEFHAMMCTFVFDKTYRTHHRFCDRLENPKDPIRVAFEELPLQVKAYWKSIVGVWFSHILKERVNCRRAEALH